MERIALFAVEQLRLIHENFSMSVATKEVKRTRCKGVHLKDDIEKYERLMEYLELSRERVRQMQETYAIVST